MRRFKDALYLVTDSTNLDEEEFLERVYKACKSGVDIVQIREKEKTARKIMRLGETVKEITEKFNIPLIIDDRVDIAYALGVGVHLGSSDLPVSVARKILGPDAIIGASAKSVEVAKVCERQGANYLGVGAIRPTKTKVITKLTSVDTLDDISKNVDIDVFAIGGLNKDNIDILNGLNISGVCVVRAVMQRSDSDVAVQELKQKIKSIRSQC